jgi:hypothetical protein
MATVVDALGVASNASVGTLTTRPANGLPTTAAEGEIVYLSAPASLYQYRAGVWVLLGIADALHNYTIGTYRINMTYTAALQMNSVVPGIEIDLTYGALRSFLDDNGAATAVLSFDLGYASPLMITSGNGLGGLNMTLTQIQAVNCVNVDALYTFYRDTGGASLTEGREQLQLFIMDPATGLQVGGTTTFPICSVYEGQPKDQHQSHRNVGVISWQSPSHQPFLSQLTGTRRLACRIKDTSPNVVGIRLLNGLLYFGSVRYSVN